ILFLLYLALAIGQQCNALQPPTGLVCRSGDQSVVLHWNKSTEPGVRGYNVYRSSSNGCPGILLNKKALLTSPGYCDVGPGTVNGLTNYYQVAAIGGPSSQSEPSDAIAAVPHAFADNNEFLDYLQQVSFDYFWYLANPANGLIPDRSAPGSACSIAAVGFGLTSIAIGIDHGWISRAEGASRVLATLKTFLHGPQGPGASGMIGYKGWFYHFLNMNTAVRANGELSSIDTALLVAGILDSKQYFDRDVPDEAAIRKIADTIFARLDWSWMSRGSSMLSMGWLPGSGFIKSNWLGYNEAMILLCLGLGTPTNSLPSSAWEAWTKGYTWKSYYGQSYVPFAPLFGYQYSHCWIDFRDSADAFMNAHNLTYFENSRRASLAQRSYCIANPLKHAGYDGLLWGLTACDGPPGYSAHGAPPPQDDDGTIAPTAAGGSIAFTPEYSIPTLRHIYDLYRPQMWTAYGFRDALNMDARWFGPDELGIDQGPIVIMIENYRTERVWRRFMKNEVIQRGLQRAGFVPVNFRMATPKLKLPNDSDKDPTVRAVRPR
ncbi:MAG TPA: glucoamylase family protein, partial [Patescibacteria group bacterium]|nr:glucoamylase family protein [Patescibacteria group bacterium]